jgi:hypothetical protein
MALVATKVEREDGVAGRKPHWRSAILALENGR